MHYQDLFIGHKAFWKIDRNAKYYELYMRQQKSWAHWPDSVSITEMQKLLRFVPTWDPKYKGKNAESLADIFYEILPTVKELYADKLENVKFDSVYLQKIRHVFDKVARYKTSYESTDASKILHMILPNLLVMWDKNIRQGILGKENKKKGSMYALDFLPKMQNELLEAVDTCMEEENLQRDEAVSFIRRECGNEYLPKLVYELNYVFYTPTSEFRDYLLKIKDAGEVSIDVFSRLFENLLQVDVT
ncbi:MAG: hypothetical protein IAX21_01500 [Candidatus Bathyarchaeota archaeon]|nr:MAG: hypothetical protein NUK63_04295 [Candidatus Bathyarchaeum tardum]WNZ29574.1 MAG: hypothetical protein IAX21_01500 [Candidatus Bathyarchaeota archaeon]